MASFAGSSFSTPESEDCEVLPLAAPVLTPSDSGLDISSGRPSIDSYIDWRIAESRLLRVGSPNSDPVESSLGFCGLATGLVVSCFWIASTVEL